MAADRTARAHGSPRPAVTPAPAHTFVVRASVADDDDDAGAGAEAGTATDGEVKEGPDGVRYREKEVEGLVTPPVDRSGRRIRYCVLEVRFSLVFHSSANGPCWRHPAPRNLTLGPLA